MYLRSGGMLVRTEQFEAVIVSADLKSMQKAAETLHTSSQNISRLIRTFEEEMQVKVFVRNKHGVFLTDDGEYIVGELKKIMACVDSLRDHYLQPAADPYADRTIPQLHILTAPPESDMIATLLERVSDKFELQSAAVDVQDARTINSRLEADMAQMMADYELIITNFLDAEMTYVRSRLTGGTLFFLYKNRLGVHLSADNPLSSKALISVRDLVNQTLIARSTGTQALPHVLMAIDSIGVNLKPRFVLNNERSCEHFIRCNKGFSFVPLRDDSRDTYILPQTRIIPLKEQIFITHVAIVRNELLGTAYGRQILSMLQKRYKYLHEIY